jgi:hypothetical protein
LTESVNSVTLASMKFVSIKPAEAITTRDFPVHSVEVLKRYFELYRNGAGDELPPVPLIHADLFFPHFEEQEKALLEEYLRQNPEVKYFLLNGSHRTTAATLTRNIIRGMVLVTCKDILEAERITFKDKPYEHRLLDTIEANIRDMAAHFIGTERFESVQQKTDRMVDEKVIPTSMIDHYEKVTKK